MVDRLQTEAALTEFQKNAELRLAAVASDFGLELRDRGIEFSAGKSGHFPVLEFKIEGLEFWIDPDEAYVGGKGPKGLSVDARFEKWDFKSVRLLEDQLVRQVTHFLEGGNSYLPYRR